MQLKDIEKQICNLLKPFPKYALMHKLSDSQWTREIKEILGDLGIENGYKVCASGFSTKFSAEWLFDITWYKENGKGNLVETSVIFESEWDTKIGGIKFDFEKLLVAKAEYKVMIFQAYATNFLKIVNQLKQGVTDFKGTIPNDRYLFIGYDGETESFKIDQLIVK